MSDETAKEIMEDKQLKTCLCLSFPSACPVHCVPPLADDVIFKEKFAAACDFMGKLIKFIGPITPLKLRGRIDEWGAEYNTKLEEIDKRAEAQASTITSSHVSVEDLVKLLRRWMKQEGPEPHTDVEKETFEILKGFPE